MSTKIHATVDALDNPTGFHLTAGQASDLEGADVLLARTDAQAVIADKAYDAHEQVVEPLLRQGKQVVIPVFGRAKLNAGMTAMSTKSGISLRTSLHGCSSTGGLPRAMTKRQRHSWEGFILRPLSSGSIDDEP